MILEEWLRLISLGFWSLTIYSINYFLGCYLKDWYNLDCFSNFVSFNLYYLVYIYRWIFLISIIKYHIESKLDISYRKESKHFPSKFLRLNPIMNLRIWITITGHEGLTTLQNKKIIWCSLSRLGFIWKDKQIQPLSNKFPRNTSLPVFLLDVIRREEMPGCVVVIVVSVCHFPLPFCHCLFPLSLSFFSLRNYLDSKCSSPQRNLARKSSVLVQPRKRLIFGDEFIRKDISHTSKSLTFTSSTNHLKTSIWMLLIRPRLVHQTSPIVSRFLLRVYLYFNFKD